jgi:predicted metallo-beta-lactamase superfamily hydrolase
MEVANPPAAASNSLRGWGETNLRAIGTKILPIAFDSFGVRSMSTLVSIGDLTFHIDPGVALGPTRYGLGPTDAELKALELSREKIMEVSRKAEVSIVTHYHYDHHPFPDDDEMYERCFKDKLVLAKDRTKDINLSGKKRGQIFDSKARGLARAIEWADDKDFELGGIHVSFSPAVWHGEVGSKVGRVIMVYMEKGKDSLLFGSDAQNLADPKALEWVLEKDPRFMILDGFPTIFLGWRMAAASFERSKENLKRAIQETRAETIILDHHILRDIQYKEKMEDIFELAADLKKRLLSAAEFYGLENFFLEAWRKEISRGERRVDVEAYFKGLSDKIDPILDAGAG